MYAWVDDERVCLARSQAVRGRRLARWLGEGFPHIGEHNELKLLEIAAFLTEEQVGTAPKQFLVGDAIRWESCLANALKVRPHECFYCREFVDVLYRIWVNAY